MELRMNGEIVELSPRAEVMIGLIVKHQHEIESHSHGEVRFSYHQGEIVMDIRTVRERKPLTKVMGRNGK